MGGAGSLHVPRRLVGFNQRGHQEHTWRNAGEDCQERVSPDTPPQCRPADEDRRLQRADVQACNAAGFHRAVLVPCRYLRLHDDCRGHRFHQLDDDNAKQPWQRRADTGLGDWSDNVVERTARLCQMDQLVPHACRASRTLLRPGAFHPFFLERELGFAAHAWKARSTHAEPTPQTA